MERQGFHAFDVTYSVTPSTQVLDNASIMEEAKKMQNVSLTPIF